MELNLDLKDIAKEMFYYVGITRFLLWTSRSIRHPKLVIFTYHRVCPSAGGHRYLSVPNDVFEGHMKFIRDNFKVVSLTDGLKALEENSSREIYAAINLDDGYMDNYLNAYPVLKKYGMPATIFLTTDFIGKRHVFWWDRVSSIVSSLEKPEMADRINADLKKEGEQQIERLVKGLEEKHPSAKRAEPVQMLGWAEIKKMARDGISFGCHTKTHRNLCLLDDVELEKEVAGSKREIEGRIGMGVNEFTYPFGIFDDRVRDFVKGAGFKCARTSLKGINQKDTDRFLLGAIGAGGLLRPSHLASRVSASVFRTV